MLLRKELLDGIPGGPRRISTGLNRNTSNSGHMLLRMRVIRVYPVHVVSGGKTEHLIKHNGLPAVLKSIPGGVL